MKKITASLDVKFIIACTQAFQRVLATHVSSIFSSNKTQKNLPTAIKLVKARNNQNKNPANKHFIGTRAKQSPCARTIQVTKQQNLEARNVAFVIIEELCQ